LISDLLDMSRIVSGKLNLTIERVELHSLVESAIETVQQAAAAKRIEINPELDVTGTIAGDPARLQQIVWNLLWNAVKFTPDGGRIYVTLRQSGADVAISVRDTGVGISADFLPHIFDRFKQGNPSITRRFGGLGLGLAIVKHLVDLHGGTVEAASAGDGQGATFTVTLPAGNAKSGSPHARTHSQDPILPQSNALDGLRILIVEDEQDTRDFLGRFLVSYGAEVFAAASAEEALALLPTARANLLVSDIGLPEVDGYELLHRIRGMDASAAGGIPAVALTAYARAEDRMRAFRAGYQAHIPKPVEPTELVATIADLAKLSRPPGSRR
jgi:CheY-like chemotaxis protein